MRHLVLLCLLSLLLLPLAASPAVAHAELVEAAPADGATVADPPIEVVLTFDEALPDADAARVSVVDPTGADLAAAPATVEGAVVTVPLNLAVAEGVHEVRWAVVSADDDLVEGTTTFTFAPPADVATPPDADPPAATPTSTPTPTPTSTATTDAPSPTPTASATEATAAEGSGPGPVVLGGVVLLAVLGVGAVVWARSRGVDGLS